MTNSIDPYNLKPYPNVPVNGINDTENIEINEDFKIALDRMENTNDSAFISGKAGTGKSTVLNIFTSTTKKNVVVVAPSAVAALRVKGMTIHSFFKFPPKIIEPSDIKKVINSLIYESIDTIIIDEISMVRADLLDGIDLFMRINGRDPSKPFGGAQVIFFGDLLQLPPVLEEEAEEAFLKMYKSPYFFDANVMKDFKLKYIELNKVYRQTDEDFINILDKIRIGEISQDELKPINGRKDQADIDGDIITLTATNDLANSINKEKLKKINSPEYIYKASIEGDFKISKTTLPADSELSLKKGAKVVFVKNDPQKLFVNGDTGVVEDCDKSFVKVKLDNGQYVVNVCALSWDKIKYEYDPISKNIVSKVTGRFVQIPLRLGWALTVHKTQSLTFNRIHIDLSRKFWEYSQIYVGLSRCRSLQGITITGDIYSEDIKIDLRVTEFLDKLKNSQKREDGT